MPDFKGLAPIFSDFLPSERILTDEQSRLFYGRDWLKDFTPNPALVLLPESTREVQLIVEACIRHRIPIVPSGGRTGLSGGATATQGEVIVSLERMRKILEINSMDRTVRCEAGVTLEQLQVAVSGRGLYFPVDFSSRGSAQIGGNIATNAGGIRVIKYGNYRQSVLGMTVVTGTGSILNLNGALFKNNSGYDLRNLFVGSEGTLGIITEAILTLTSLPKECIRVLCGLERTEAILPLLEFCRDSGLDLSAFELMERLPFQEVVTHRGLRDPLSKAHHAYALVEIEVTEASALERIQERFAEAYEQNLIQDVVVSENASQASELMNLRDLISETLSQHHTIHKNDISVPVPMIPEFISDLRTSLASAYPTFQVAIFGHVGDGNLHVNVLKPPHMEDLEFWDLCHQADHIIFQSVSKYKGSISAEHGVGLLKRDFLHYCRTPDEISLMRGIKSVFDPHSILNPGKVLPDT